MAGQPAPARSRSDGWGSALDALVSGAADPAVAWQPIVDLARGAVVGFEALARFPAPPQEPPDRWFTAAAERGMSARLEARVLARALDAAGQLPADTFLTVNVDPGQLADAAVRDVLADREPLHDVVVEITGHAGLVEHPGALNAVDWLREVGARIAVDDAGADHADLRALLQLTPELVKIDRRLVAGCDREPARRALIRTVGQFASDLDALVVAEGVEHPAQLEVLADLGVPLAQGFLLGRPGEQPAGGPPAPVRRLLEGRRTSDRHVA